MSLKHFCIVLSVFSLMYSCAIRDNPYDPMSPLYKSPHLSVALNFDSSKVNMISNETISAKAPFIVSIDAQSRDYLNVDDNMPVKYEHIFNKNIVSQEFNFSAKTDTIKENGLHVLSFTSTGSNGAKTVKEVTLLITAPRNPTIQSFKCNVDTLPLNIKNLGYLTTVIIDTDMVARKIIYKVSDLDMQEINLSQDSALFTNTSATNNLFSLTECTHILTAYVEDLLGHRDSMTTTVIFSKNKKMIYGKPPVIDSIFIPEVIPVIYENDPFQFTVSAYDPDSGKITNYFWDFGDGSSYNDTLPGTASHQYMRAGSFVVEVTVADDSGNATKGSLLINVKEARKILPHFTMFEVKNDSGPAPLTITVSIAAKDDDGEVTNLALFFSDKGATRFDTQWQPITDKSFFLDSLAFPPGTYYIHAIATDNTNNSCDTTHKIIITGPDSSKQ